MSPTTSRIPSKPFTFAAEGTSEFKALLYLPGKKPFDLFMAERKRGIQLYVKRVFITEKCDALLPDYLRFVRGVVDFSRPAAEPFSREILQEDVQIKRIQKSLVGKVITTLSELKEKEYDEYVKFWSEFGPVLKEVSALRLRQQGEAPGTAAVPKHHHRSRSVRLS